jgi:hypothetical protein
LKENKNDAKILVGPVLTYTSETSILSKTEERLPNLFERRVLRCISGAVQENGTWRKNISMNYRNYLMTHMLLSTIKLTDLGRLGVSCLWIATGQARTEGTRKGRRPQLRWEDGVTQDLEDFSIEKGRVAKFSEEGQGPQRAVVPMMMMNLTQLIENLK